MSANLSVDDRGNLVGLFSLMMGVLFISLLVDSLVERKVFVALLVGCVVHLCVVGLLDILSQV